ncbi:MAG: hypothetical protein K9L78_03540, partial [Victivallales bacterium]|nr:hypothetical protein [Victivallales bacterium]
MIKFLKNKSASLENRKYHLYRMNEPALIARQHAAYDRAIELFSNNLFSYSANQRSKIYKAV